MHASLIGFFLTINYHFQLMNIILFCISHSTCDFHLFRFKIESYLDMATGRIGGGFEYPRPRPRIHAPARIPKLYRG